jgi:hypothetical protein
MTVARLLRIIAVTLVVLGIGYWLFERMLYRTVENPPPRERIDEKDDTVIPPQPPLDESLAFIRETEKGTKLRINNSTAVFRLDVASFTPEENVLTEGLSPDYISAMERAKDFDVPFLPSVQMIDGKGKQFNDGLYAAIELYLQGEKEAQGLKSKFLNQLLSKLLEFRKNANGFAKDVADAAIIYIAIGMELSGQKADLPTELRDEVKESSSNFIKAHIKSKPLGFYNWNERLQQIFQQDRYYQKILDIKSTMQTGAAVLISHIILNDPELSKEHITITKLCSNLTNPMDALTVQDYAATIRKYKTLDDIIGSSEKIKSFLEALVQDPVVQERIKKETSFHGAFAEIGLALIPFSESKETDLFNKVFGLKPVPENVELMEFLIEQIKKGAVDLKPKPNSGWYDYQIHALETLLLPEKAQESKKLLLTAKYKERLKEAFKTMIVKARETHVKQLRIPFTKSAGPPPKPEIITPHLVVEPTATVYLRQARGYHFLKNVLPAILGNDVLSGLHRLREDDNPVEMSLKDELDRMMYLMYGIYALASRDLGMKPDLMQGELSNEEFENAKKIADDWLKNLEKDNDLAKDTRIIVPIHEDEVQGKTTYWATIGVRLLKIKIQYIYPPTIAIIKKGRTDIPVKFYLQPGEAITTDTLDGGGFRLQPQEYIIAADVFKEIRKSNREAPMTRDEFRQRCDIEYGKGWFITPLEGVAIGVGVGVVLILVFIFRKRLKVVLARLFHLARTTFSRMKKPTHH